MSNTYISGSLNVIAHVNACVVRLQDHFERQTEKKFRENIFLPMQYQSMILLTFYGFLVEGTISGICEIFVGPRYNSKEEVKKKNGLPNSYSSLEANLAFIKKLGIPISENDEKILLDLKNIRDSMAHPNIYKKENFTVLSNDKDFIHSKKAPWLEKILLKEFSPKQTIELCSKVRMILSNLIEHAATECENIEKRRRKPICHTKIAEFLDPIYIRDTNFNGCANKIRCLLSTLQTDLIKKER